jgi:hypothetical protein
MLSYVIMERCLLALPIPKVVLPRLLRSPIVYPHSGGYKPTTATIEASVGGFDPLCSRIIPQGIQEELFESFASIVSGRRSSLRLPHCFSAAQHCSTYGIHSDVLRHCGTRGCLKSSLCSHPTQLMLLLRHSRQVTQPIIFPFVSRSRNKKAAITQALVPRRSTTLATPVCSERYKIHHSFDI